MRIKLSTSSSLLWIAGGLISCVSAKAILGVDLGSLYMKVALVQRGAPLEIVTNLHSKRKTEQMVLFDQGTRFYGSDASSLQARKPTKTPVAMTVMLGRDEGHPAVKVLTEQHFPLTPKYNETRKGLYILVDGKESYTPEELTAMLLNHAEEMTHAYGGEKGYVYGNIQDCVLTVPSFATQVERQAYYDAAELADFKVLSLIDENTAAAVHFGMDKLYEEPQIILFYNLGASALQVSVIKFDTYEVPESKHSKKTKKVGSIEVLGKAWDSTLGGNAFDKRLVDYMADHFNREWRHAKGHEKDIRDIPRAMTKLRLQANKVKHVLSANQEIPVHMDALHDDMTLSMHITRAQFEELCDDLMERAVAPIHDAIKMANLTLENINAIELIGGGMRVPKVQNDMSKMLGNMELGLHINSDESMALGAAFFGANLSTAFRVRHVGLTDINPFPIKLSLEDLPKEKKGGLFGGVGKKKDDGGEAWSKEATIFKSGGKIGVKKTIAFTHDKDVHCSLDYADPETTLPKGSAPELQRYKITGIAEFAKEVEEKGLGKPKISLQFEMSQSGITDLVKAEAAVEETYTVQEEVEVEDEEQGESSGNSTEETKDSEKATENEDEKPEEPAKATESETSSEEESTPDATGRKTEETAEEDEKPSENEDSEKAAENENAEAASGEDSAKASTEPEKKDASKEKPKKDKKKKKKTKLVEKEKKRTVRKTLVVEKYYVGKIQPMSKELLEESKAKLAELARKDQERAMLEAAKNKVESYIYQIKNKLVDDEERVSKVSTEEQREELRKLAEDGEEWLYDEGYDADLATMEAKYAELSEPAEKVWFRLKEMTARPEAVAALEKKLTIVGEILKKWETTMPHITEEERADVMEKVADIKKWISEKEAEQAAKQLHEDPAFTSEEVPQQSKALERLMAKLSKKPKPKVEKKDEEKDGANETSSGETAEGTPEKAEGDDETANDETSEEKVEGEDGTAQDTSGEKAGDDGKEEDGSAANAEEEPAEDETPEVDEPKAENEEGEEQGGETSTVADEL